MPNRCVNLDWLEVYAIEIGQRDPEYFTALGYEVKVRAYGSPQYRQMFTIYENGFPTIEIRRDPYSLRSQGGIFPKGACHLRLSNRSCYMMQPVRFLYQFMLAHGFRYQSISRIDIALDFNEFDSGKKPETFISQIMKEEVAKINQPRINAHGKEYCSTDISIHGTDSWHRRVWNSIKWGSPTSCVTTKMYNKTLELKQVHDKLYIRDVWEQAGLDTSRDIWRIEFSINSQGQTLSDKRGGGYIKKNLSDYETRFQLLFQWQILANKYFHFKKKVRTNRGGWQRKDRCPDVFLFDIHPDAETWNPVRNPPQFHEPTRTLKMLVKRLMETWEDIKIDRVIRNNALDLAKHYIYVSQMSDTEMKRSEARMLEIEHKLPLTLELRPDMTSTAWESYNKGKLDEAEMRMLRRLQTKYGDGHKYGLPF